MNNFENITCDVVIVGSGVAALVCALSLPKDQNIVLITKKSLIDSNSYLAQGGICVMRGDSDRDSFIEDTLRAGHFQNDKEAVEILVDESNAAIKTLQELGVVFTGDENGPYYTREGGHSNFRILYHDDVTGKSIMESLIETMKKRKNINIMENCSMTDLLISKKNEECLGIYAIHNGKNLVINSRSTVLATGGIGGIYKNSTNFPHIRGDGIALAIKHNIELKDISYVQIHPTALYEEKLGRRFLISESVRGEGAQLINHKHERFTNELNPRDIVSKAILKEMEKDGTKYELLDLNPLKDSIEKRFPNIYNKIIEIGLNPLKDPIPVVPSQHYTMGGIKVDMDSKTSMKNLYAIGEVACTGVHGKNRLASNSLLEGVVFAKRSAKSIIKENPPLITYMEDLTKKTLISDAEISLIIKERIYEDELAKAK
ncbi:L-aspartate oxidase [Peptostreptococcus russellii]|uniref:L-aspartate oxidase n=1 Tax=Peptostreptococcus russellii TaxID=215200 RepID=A0A2P7Q2Z7_9FIRM|nr:L-aspartate oxidase [Peptostreptococcus russellii]PSJ32320.1 L-aspartate oxidase [Peptostreptococcus russellii]